MKTPSLFALLLLTVIAGWIAPRPAAAAATECTGPTCWLTVKPAEVDSKWNFARCNDGTPASYEMRPSPSGSNAWVILLQGGGDCDDLANLCSERHTKLTTTSPNANNSWVEIFHGGILNPSADENPDFYDANLVQINYCSSDTWTGATQLLRPTTATPQCQPGDSNCGWYFSGRLNVQAAIASMKRDHGLRDNGSQRVLFVGTSAGGLGLAANAEAITQQLSNSFQAGSLKFLIDGAYTLADWDVPDHYIGDSGLTSANKVATKARTFWRGHYETYCERDRAAQGLNPALCTFGSVYYPYLVNSGNGLGLQLLIQNSTLDLAATKRLSLTDPNDPAREVWRCSMTASLADVNWLFSSGDSYHTLSARNDGFNAGPTGNSFRDLVGRFWRDEPAQQLIYHNPPCGS